MAAERLLVASIVAMLASVGCARAGDPCAAHDACGSGLCHVGRCTGEAGPVVTPSASRRLLEPTALLVVDDDGDVDELRFSATHGATRVYAQFPASTAPAARSFLLVDPLPSAPPWDVPVTIDVFPIDEPWTADGGEPRLGVRAFSVTFPAGPARRMRIDLSTGLGRHGVALRSPDRGGVGARMDARSMRLDVYGR